MKCSKCGSLNHNVRKCPHRDEVTSRDMAVWVKFDNITRDEADKIHIEIVKMKSFIAPKARATLAKGKPKELPKQIQNAHGILGTKDEKEKQKTREQTFTRTKKGKILDAYVCFFCHLICKKNHGHHIIKYAEGGVASTDNIITLCPQCHRDYHSGKIQVDIFRF